MQGFKLAACFSFPPSRLGFCGARIKNTAKVLTDYLSGKEIPLKKIRKILENFEASYPYYQLIAKVNKINDPLDYKVVEAYWLGNKLLEKVKPNDIRNLILHEFSKPGLLSKAKAEKKASSIPDGARVHHTFHVLLLGSVTGRVKFTARIFDLCRVGWGRVIRLIKERKKLVIKYAPLIIKNKKFLLGKEIEREIDWDKRILVKIKAGDRVAFHWNLACKVINKIQEENLLKYTLLNIKASNGPRK